MDPAKETPEPTRKYYTPRLGSPTANTGTPRTDAGEASGDSAGGDVELLTLDDCGGATSGAVAAPGATRAGVGLLGAAQDIESGGCGAKGAVPPAGSVPRQDFFDKVDFLLALCASLHRYGEQTHRLEYQITWAADALSIEAAVAVFPTYISAMFREKDSHHSFTYNLSNESSWDLEKLELADDLVKRVATRKINIRDGIYQLQRIQEKHTLNWRHHRCRPPRYHWWAKLVCMTVMSGVICPLYFRGGVVESALSLCLGLVAGLVLLVSEHTVAFARLHEPVTSLVCALAATVISVEGWLGPVSAGCVMLAGVVWVLPGLQLNKSISDLATHMMVSGTSRLLYAMLIIFELAFGLSLGSRITDLLHPAAPDAAESLSGLSDESSRVPSLPISVWFDLLWTPVAACSFAVMLGAAPRQLPAIIVSGAFASLVALLRSFLGAELATMMAQAAIVLTGNVYARVFDKPAFIPTCVGSLMLVPSALGARGVATAIVSHNTVSSMQFTFAMLITSVSMVVGGFLANMVLFPKKAF
eukprot:m51a1_g5002 hypothetical protein (530) ;mRNA; f:223653-225773